MVLFCWGASFFEGGGGVVVFPKIVHLCTVFYGIPCRGRRFSTSFYRRAYGREATPCETRDPFKETNQCIRPTCTM